MAGGFQGDSVIEGLNRVRHATTSGGAQKFGSDDLRPPVDSRHADTIISARADNSRYVGAVAVVVVGIPGVGDCVDPEIVIHVTVAIIVSSVGANLPRIGPHITRQIGVVIVDTGIDDEDYRLIVSSPGRVIPSRREAHARDRVLVSE